MPTSVRLRLTSLAALVAFAWILCVRLHIDMPYDRDVSVYAVIGHEMMHGRNLYTDLFDQKPPAVYVTYAAAELVTGFGERAVLLLYFAGSAAILAGLWAFGRRRQEGWNTACLFLPAALMMSSLSLESIGPNSEIFINACLVWAFVIASSNRRPLSVPRLAAAAALVALASLYKHVAVVPGGLFLLARLWSDGGESIRGRIRSAVRGGLIVGAVVAGAWALTWLYFAARGRGSDFIDTMIRYNLGYSGLEGGWLAKSIPNLRDTLGSAPIVIGLCAVAASLAALLTPAVAAIRRRPEAFMALAYLAGAAVAVALPAQFFPHYFQLLIPPVAIAWSLVSEDLPRTASARSAMAAVAAFALIMFAGDSVAAYRVNEESMSRMWGDRFTPARDVAGDLDALLTPGETFFDWGNEAWLFFYTQRRPPAGVFFADHARRSALAGRITRRALADLRAAPPEVVVVSRWVPSERSLSGNAVGQWIGEHYSPLPGYDYGFLYFMARNDGRLLSDGNR